MDGTKIFQIVGYQNSGKTTIMNKLIMKGASRGLRIGTIKHHGHGGTPDKKLMEKDSELHKAAGADLTSVEGEGVLQLEMNRCWSLPEIIGIYRNFPLDLILVEGYKFAHYPKALLVRNSADLVLLEHLKNIHIVISWLPFENLENYDVFSIKDVDLFVEVFFDSFYERL